MAVYKVFPLQDTTLYSKYSLTNAGRDEILEVGSRNNPTLQGLPVVTTTGLGTDDIRRTLISFAPSDINAALALTTGSYATNLRLFLADAKDLSTDYTLEFYPLQQSWQVGTGKLANTPTTSDGASWTYTGQSGSSTVWNTAAFSSSYLYTTGGGTWNTVYRATQSFNYISDKDVNVDITNMTRAWVSSSIGNYGVIVKLTGSIELNTQTFMNLQFYSMDTHTIYPPCLEFKWDDCIINTGSTNVGTTTSDNFILLTSNNLDKYKEGQVYNFKLKTREQFPTRQFTTSSVYLNWKYLPSQSYWGLQDYKTNEMVVDFDNNYTKISANSEGNFFKLYTAGLEPERSYKILVKSVIPSTSETVIVDNDIIFKVVR
jgi:hypothetical protein